MRHTHNTQNKVEPDAKILPNSSYNVIIIHNTGFIDNLFITN